MAKNRIMSGLTLLLALVTFACGGSTGTTSSGLPLSGKTVWYDDLIAANPAILAIAQGINHVIVANGGTMYQTFAQTASGAIDTSLLAQNMERAIAAKPAAIAYFELETTLLKPQVEQAAAAGIPTFAIQGEPSGFQANGWIDFDNMGNGIALAKELAKAMPAGGKFTVIASTNTGAPQLVVTSAISTLQAMGFVYVGDFNQQRDVTDDTSGGQKVMQSILQNHPDISGLLSYNDAAALGAIAAIKAAGLQGKIAVTGRNADTDALAAIKSGDLLATCDIQVVGVGEAVGQAIVDKVSGKVAYANNMQIPFPRETNGCIIDKSNVDQVKTNQELVNYVNIPTK